MKLVILCGPSASGKDYTAKSLVSKYGFDMLISDTTRPMRSGEKDGIDYNFKTRESFLENKDDYIEYRSYDTLLNGKKDTWYYGTPKFESLNNNTVLIKDLKGAKKIKDYCDTTGISCEVYLITASEFVREKRAKLRGSFDETEWKRRIFADRKDFSDIEVNSINNIIIIDNDYETDIADAIAKSI